MTIDSSRVIKQSRFVQIIFRFCFMCDYSHKFVHVHHLDAQLSSNSSYHILILISVILRVNDSCQLQKLGLFLLKSQKICKFHKLQDRVEEAPAIRHAGDAMCLKRHRRKSSDTCYKKERVKREQRLTLSK